MKYALLGYMIVFAAGVVVMIAAVVLGRIAGEKDEDSAIEQAFDVLTVGVLMAGMIFIWRGMEYPFLKSSWKLIAPSIGALALWTSWRARRETINSDEGRKDPQGIRFIDGWTIALLGPSIALNVWYAFR
jgi:hypothetical protein